MRDRALSGFAVLLSMMLAASTANAAVYDLQSDWSESSNPNGPWAFRHGSTLLTWFSEIPVTGIANQGMWGTSNVIGNFVPVAFRAAYDGSVIGLDYLAGDIFLGARDFANGSMNGVGTIAWTSPVSGTIDITGSIWTMRAIGRSTDWALVLDDTTLNGGNLSGATHSRNNALPLNFTGLAVSIGDVLEFRFDTPANQLGDPLGLSLTITTHNEAQPAPEPATLAVLSATVVAFGALRRRPGHGTHRR